MKNINVLLVEDNQINQLLAGRLLRKWGLGVTIANHGKEALAMVSCKSFQLILMDLQMPEMDGFESTLKIRSMNDVYFKNIPILAFTNLASISVLDKASKCGINDFVNKPLVSEDFQNKIGKYLNIQENVMPQPNKSARTLSIDFDFYTEGDHAFKQELILLMISNIHELLQSLQNAIECSDMKIFRKVHHKVQPTLAIINDNELSDVMAQLKSENSPPDNEKKTFSLFKRLCVELISSLEEACN